MSLCQDRQIKGFLLFLTLFALLFVGTASVIKDALKKAADLVFLLSISL